MALLSAPMPSGNRIGILTEGGGIGVVAAEICDKIGLQLPSFSPATTQKLRDMLPPRCSYSNTADMTDVITAGKSPTFPCLWAIMDDPNVDAAILLGGVGASTYFTSLMGADFVEELSSSDIDKFKKMLELIEAEELKNMRITKEKIEKSKKPVFFVNLIPRSILEPPSFKLLRENNIPVYRNPKRAAKVLKHLTCYHQYLREVSRPSSTDSKGAFVSVYPNVA